MIFLQIYFCCQTPVAPRPSTTDSYPRKMQRSFSASDLSIRGQSVTTNEQHNQPKNINTRKQTPRRRPHSAKEASNSRTHKVTDEKVATKRPQSANVNNETKKQVCL